MRSRLSAVGRAALGLLVLLAGGCSSKIDEVFRDNLSPEVRLTQAPVSTTDPYFYAYRMNWVGYDPDGRVDYFLIAVDPARPDSVDATWQRTTKNEEILFFRATRPDSTNGFATATDYHTFSIAAVDNKGSISKPVWRSFNSFTIAPFVFIESPRPNSVFTPIVTPVVRIRWRGIDLDGQFTTKPVKFKYHLFRPRDPDFPGVDDPVVQILANPNILRWKYAPTFGPNPNCTYCSYWDSTNAETTEVQYTNLIPNNIYLFAVTGFDEAGAYDPVFSPNSNMLKFAVTYAGTLGPQICMFNEFFNFCYPSGGYASDPSRYFNVEVPAGDPQRPTEQTVTFKWFAVPPQGADIRFYRWVLDLQDLTDETPRTDENTDWYHWSSYSFNTQAATIGPFFNNGEDHLFYIEAEDNNGLRSLGIIHFTVVRATLEHDLLFVDDTRLTPDQRSAQGGYDPPRGVWPSAAELDTFFFAVGGKPWIGYPPGTLSRPGIFNGFTYDTVGTRGIVSGIVPLARLGQYKLVAWYTDDVGSTYVGNPVDLLQPTTSLRFISSPGHPSTISTYLKQGGKVWLSGGGAAYATLAAWQKRNTPPDEFTNSDLELVPGRFMFDFAHWQSAVTVRPSQFGLLNASEILASFPQYPGRTTAAPGRGYTGHGMNRDLNQPDYNKLKDLNTGVAFLSPRTCATDPPSPLRICDSFYILQYYTAEFIGTFLTAVPNFIREDANPDPDRVREESTLDTLYLCLGGTAPNFRPVMTYYHGFETPQVVFCGFPMWQFQRGQVERLADFVLRDIFGLTRSLAPAAPVRATAALPSAGRTGTVTRPAAAPLRR